MASRTWGRSPRQGGGEKEDRSEPPWLPQWIVPFLRQASRWLTVRSRCAGVDAWQEFETRPPWGADTQGFRPVTVGALSSFPQSYTAASRPNRGHRSGMAAHEGALHGACHPDMGELSSAVRFYRINLDADSDVWENAHSLQLTECHATTSRKILPVVTTDDSRPVGAGYVRRSSIGVQYNSPLANPNRSVRPSRGLCGSSLWSRRCLYLHVCSGARTRSTERFAKRGRPARGSDEGTMPRSASSV